MKLLGRILLGLVALILVVGTIGWLSLRRPDIPWATLEARYANPESQWVDLPGGLKVHYRDQGNPAGPVLVMVHGFAANLETWEPWVRRLGKDYRIVSLDLPGFGLTRAPNGYRLTDTAFDDTVEGVADHLKLGKFAIVGNSMGGAVAWRYALRHPDRLDGLVLVNAAGWPEKAAQEGSPIIFRILANPIGRALLRDLDSSHLTRQGLRSAFEPTPDMATDAMVARYVEMARAPGHRDIILGMMSGPDGRVFATSERLSKIAVPTLVIHGDTDRLIDVSAADKFGKAIPGAKVIVYEKVGHIPMEQIADRSAADLDAWLKARPKAP
ncbi:MAG TPA: alpha/beta hydrolase [Caulobacter sp.]|nr:alpha/beta hydrolase [Caulobacter sp.]